MSRPPERAGPAAPGVGTDPRTPGAQAAAPVPVPLLLATVFVTGGATMMIEVLGTRVIGPFYGVSLYVWSSLIAVTLGALAAGYAVGGRIADRRPEALPPWLMIALAAAFVAAIPLLRAPVLVLTDGLGVRAGALASAFLLFSTPLFFLAMIGPSFIRLAARDVALVGSLSGGVFAVSTVGSVLGTLAVGFFLLPLAGTTTILGGISTSLGALAVALFALLRVPATRAARRLLVAALLVTAVLVLLPVVGPAREDPRFSTPLDVEGHYGRVRVVVDRRTSVRWLLADASTIGAALPDGAPIFPFLHHLEALPAFRPGGERALLIGLGAGYLPRALAKLGIVTDVIEIDPAVVRAAREHFGFETAGRTITGDARYEIRKLGRDYDYVIHDCFTGGSMPFHLLSVEVMRDVRAVLKPGGLLGLNYYGFWKGRRAVPAAAVDRTLRAVFPHVEAVATLDQEPIDVLFFASDEPFRLEAEDGVLVTPGARWALPRFAGLPRPRPEPGVGFVVTDDYNPLDTLQQRKAEAYRAFVVGRLGLDLLAR